MIYLPRLSKILQDQFVSRFGQDDLPRISKINKNQFFLWLSKGIYQEIARLNEINFFKNKTKNKTWWGLMGRKNYERIKFYFS